jgi:hypothetical protein
MDHKIYFIKKINILYFNVKDNIEKMKKQFVYNFNILNEYGDEWDI